MDELANINALYNEAKEIIEQSKVDASELEELREMKSDIERKEKQQAAIIENQVRSCWWMFGDKSASVMLLVYALLAEQNRVMAPH